MIVVGSTGRGSIGRTLGTTADRLLHSAQCPVAVSPAGYRRRTAETLERIGAAFCPGPEGVRALAAAGAIATEWGAALEHSTARWRSDSVIAGSAGERS